MSQKESTVVVEKLDEGATVETYKWKHELRNKGFYAGRYIYSFSTPRFEIGAFCHPSWRGWIDFKDDSFQLHLPCPVEGDEDLSWTISEVSAGVAPSHRSEEVVPMSMTQQGPPRWIEGKPEVFFGQYNYARMGLRPYLLYISVKVMGQRSDLSPPGPTMTTTTKADLPSLITAEFNSHEFSDFKVFCEDETFLCHKMILGVGSPVFKQMFLTLNTTEAREGRVRIEDVSKETLKLMLKWMYGEDIGHKITTFEARVELFQLAHRYLIHALKDSLVEDICRAVTPEGAFGLYLLGVSYSEDKFKAKATEVMKRDKERAFPTEIFHECYKRFPELLGKFLKGSDSTHVFFLPTTFTVYKDIKSIF